MVGRRPGGTGRQSAGLATERRKWQRLKQRGTENVEAYQLYLKGRFYLNKRNEESLKRGVAYFQQAIDIDPQYALAYSGLADSYSTLGSVGISFTLVGVYLGGAIWAAYHFCYAEYVSVEVLLWFLGYQVLAVLMFLTVVFALTAWHQVQTTFGI